MIKESESWEKESYAVGKEMLNLEHPQYTRPEEVRGMRVPGVLLSGDHRAIEEWKAGEVGKSLFTSPFVKGEGSCVREAV